MHLEALTKESEGVFYTLGEFEDFYLAGGTALALQIGHRISIDFDLFSDKEIPKTLLDKVKKVFEGNSVVLSVNNPDELTVFVDGVKITFLRYPFPVLFKFIDYKTIKLLDIREISAAKAYAIGRRGSFKDYVDLYCVISGSHTSLSEIIEIADKKYSSEFNSRLFLEQLIYLEDIENTEIIFLREMVNKEEVRQFFENQVKNIKL